MSSSQAPQGLEVRGLGAELGGRVVLGDVSLRVGRGEVVAVLGPNGAGKTTLLAAIAGLTPHRGEVAVDGERLRGFRDRARRLALMPDEVELPVEASVATALGLTGDEPHSRALAIAPLLARPAAALSRGEQKRVQLAQVLASPRPVLLLDEPFAAFDPLQLRHIVPLVRQAAHQRAVLLTVHQPSTAERVADRLLLVAEGRVVADGTLAELRHHAGLGSGGLEEIFLSLLEGRRAEA